MSIDSRIREEDRKAEIDLNKKSGVQYLNIKGSCIQ